MPKPLKRWQYQSHFTDPDNDWRVQGDLDELMEDSQGQSHRDINRGRKRKRLSAAIMAGSVFFLEPFQGPPKAEVLNEHQRPLVENYRDYRRNRAKVTYPAFFFQGEPSDFENAPDPGLGQEPDHWVQLPHLPFRKKILHPSLVPHFTTDLIPSGSVPSSSSASISSSRMEVTYFLYQAHFSPVGTDFAEDIYPSKYIQLPVLPTWKKPRTVDFYQTGYASILEEVAPGVTPQPDKEIPRVVDQGTVNAIKARILHRSIIWQDLAYEGEPGVVENVDRPDKWMFPIVQPYPYKVRQSPGKWDVRNNPFLFIDPDALASGGTGTPGPGPGWPVITLKDTRDLLRKKLGDSGITAAPEVWSDAELNRYIQDGYDRLAMATGIIWKRESYNDTAGTATATLPDALHQVERVTWKDRKILPIDADRIQMFDFDYETEQGDVFGYVMEYDGLRTWRKIKVPAAALTDAGNMEYIGRGTALTSDSVTFEIPNRYVKYVCWYALGQALEREGPGQDLELSALYMTRWEDGVLRVRKRMERVRLMRRFRFGGDKRGSFRRPPLARLPWAFGPNTKDPFGPF